MHECIRPGLLNGGRARHADTQGLDALQEDGASGHRPSGSRERPRMEERRLPLMQHGRSSPEAWIEAEGAGGAARGLSTFEWRGAEIGTGGLTRTDDRACAAGARIAT